MLKQLARVIHRVTEQLVNIGNISSLKQRLIRTVMGTFGLRVADYGLGFLVSVLLTRVLGAAGFGSYSYPLAWIMLLSVPATLGLNQLLVREIAIYQANAEWGLLRGLLRWSNQVVLLISSCLALVVAVILWLTSKDTANLATMYLSLIALPLTSLRSLRLSTLKGLNHIIVGFLPEMLIAPLMQLVLTISGYLLLGKDFNSAWAMGIYLITTGLTYFLGVWLLNKVLPKELQQSPPKYQARQWLASSAPFIMLSTMQITNGKMGILVLGSFAGPAAVGIYAIAERVSTLISFILFSVNSALAPNIARLYSKGNIQKLQQVITKSTRIVFLIALPITLIVMLFSDVLTLVFGPDFGQGKLALQILCIGYIVGCSMGPANLTLNMTRHEKSTMISIAISFAIRVLFNFTFVPLWGINGAAIASSSSQIAWNIISVFYLYRKTGINTTIFARPA